MITHCQGRCTDAPLCIFQALLAVGAGVLVLVILAAVAAAALFMSRRATDDADTAAAPARGGAAPNRVGASSCICHSHQCKHFATAVSAVVAVHLHTACRHAGLWI